MIFHKLVVNKKYFAYKRKVYAIKLSSKHLFRCTARVVQLERIVKIENHPRRGFRHVVVEVSVATQSPAQRFTFTSEPRVEGIRCRVLV